MNKKQYVRKITLYKLQYYFPYLTSKKILEKLKKKYLIQLYSLQTLYEMNILNYDCIYYIFSYL